jgi:hypothetical protein
MINPMRLSFATGPRRWIAAPVLGVAACAALAALAVGANGLPVIGAPVAATGTCPSHVGPSVPCPRVPLPAMRPIVPAPLPDYRGFPMTIPPHLGSTLTPAQQTRAAAMRAQLRAYFGMPSTPPLPIRTN